MVNIHKVLIIEDEPCMKEVLKIRVEMMGFLADSADDGSIGLQMIQDNPPDIILLDLMLPKIDGFQVCRIVRSKKEFNDLPIIVITAKLGDADRERCLEYGANAYMTKPVNFFELETNIRTLLGLAAD